MLPGGLVADDRGGQPYSMHRLRHAGRWIVAALVVASVAGADASPGAARATGHSSSIIVLPGARGAEGITAGRGSTFYAGDLVEGDIFRGDVRRGTAERFIDAPAGRQALGMAADVRHHLLFVAGGPTGQGYVYDLRSGATVATYQFGAAGTAFINDVALTRQGAWFTDSLQAQLTFVPVSRHGVPGPARTLPLSGPAADTSGDFNLNGIQATADGRTLVVAHSGNSAVYTVDPRTGASAQIAGVDVPNVDGIVLSGRHLWAVRNFANRIDRYRLAPDLGAGTFERAITSDAFQIPTTAARFGRTLAAVNAKFDTGVPPTATQFEVVLVRA
jgi:sugar lactone lactonase YvrE